MLFDGLTNEIVVSLLMHPDKQGCSQHGGANDMGKRQMGKQIIEVAVLGSYINGMHEAE